MLASQSSSFAPVEVKWSPPSNRVANITGYRIFYGNGKDIFLSSVVTSVGLNLDGDHVGQNIYIHSGTATENSVIVNTTITCTSHIHSGFSDIVE